MISCLLLFCNKSNIKTETFSQSNANMWACVSNKELLHNGYTVIQLVMGVSIKQYEQKIYGIQCGHAVLWILYFIRVN